MATRLFNIAAVLSVVAFCLLLIAWLVAGAIDPHRQFVTISNGCHLSISARGADARVHVFNNSREGPYGGSILSFVGNPNNPTVSGVGDKAGIYYRKIRYPNGALWWTLSLSLIYPLMLAAVLPFAWVIRRWRPAHR